jgi:kynurenine formamidase
MAITPLYDITEINTEIAQAKLDLAAARKQLSYSKGDTLSVDREKVANLQNHLMWLQEQRMQLEGVTGPQSIIARVPRRG